MVSTASPPVPAHRHEITPVWLTSALRSTGVISPATRVITCAQHPVVAVAVSGDAREDDGGISGPQIVRLPGPRAHATGGTLSERSHVLPAYPAAPPWSPAPADLLCCDGRCPYGERLVLCAVRPTHPAAVLRTDGRSGRRPLHGGAPWGESVGGPDGQALVNMAQLHAFG
jgi:hypothetical protein